MFFWKILPVLLLKKSPECTKLSNMDNGKKFRFANKNIVPVYLLCMMMIIIIVINSSNFGSRILGRLVIQMVLPHGDHYQTKSFNTFAVPCGRVVLYNVSLDDLFNVGCQSMIWSLLSGNNSDHATNTCGIWSCLVYCRSHCTITDPV